MTNPMQIIQMMNNPERAVMQILEQNTQMKNNPMVQNALQLAMSGNSTKLKNMATNIANNKGVNLNEIMKLLNVH